MTKASKGTLVRMLSTGRSGTKFMAKVFEDQGYFSVHEDFYAGEPFVAVKHYANWLGDLWLEDKQRYFALDSNFAEPYVGGVAKALLENRKRQDIDEDKRQVVVHSGHLMTPATPLVTRELDKQAIAVRHLILMRNPLKSIHAIYTIESEVGKAGHRPYRIRPQRFAKDGGYLGAAQIWANTYRMIADQREQFGKDAFKLVWLSDFSGEPALARKVFDFLGIAFNEKLFISFTERVLNKPLRSKKEESIRNSDLYIAPDFSFDEAQIKAIFAEIDDVLDVYDIDWQSNVSEYVDFHQQEKTRMGFA